MANRRGNRPSGAWNRRTGSAAMSGLTGISRRGFLGTAAAGVAGVGTIALGARRVAYANEVNPCTGAPGFIHPTLTPMEQVICGNETVCAGLILDQYSGLDPYADWTDQTLKAYYLGLPGDVNTPLTPKWIAMVLAYAAIGGGWGRISYPILNFPEPRDVDKVPRPGNDDFDGELIQDLDRYAYAVEFEVPGSFQDPGNIKIRGWFIEGGGIDGGIKPLLIWQDGHFGSVVFPKGYPPNPERYELGKLQRDLAYHFVLHGFSVLYFDYRGGGISEGSTAVDVVNQAEDIFDAIDQLQTGCYTYNPHKGDTGPEWRAGLIAADAPIVLGGPSHGSFITSQAMMLNITENRGYNFRGTIQMDSLSTIMFENDYFDAILPFPLTQKHRASQGALRFLFGLQFYPDSEIYNSLPDWPGLLIVKATGDDSTFEGAVRDYNRARGHKDFVATYGPHGSSLLTDFFYVSKKMLQFAKKAVLAPGESVNNTSQITIEQAACMVPQTDNIPGAEQSMENMAKHLAKWLEINMPPEV